MDKALRHKALRRAARTALALLFAFALLIPSAAPAARAVTQKEINALQNNADKLADKKEALQGKLDDLADDRSAAEQKKKLLDEQIDTLSAQISNSEQQIAQYGSLISQTQAELEDAQQKEQAQYELFCQRVRAMEERGSISYWSVLFKASSFTDLLSRLDFINEIMDSDQAVITQLQTLQEQIKTKKASLESSKSAEEKVRSGLAGKKSELDTQRAAANKLVAQIDANQNEYESTLKALDAEEEAIQARIVRLSKQLAAQIEAERKRAEEAARQNGTSTNTSGSTVSSSGYIWPVSSHRITSGFGYRSASATNGVGSTYHKGIDIGGVGYTTTVRAAKSGQVIVSQYSSSYGNYVVIAHGSGNTTLYGHMSSRSVSAGQYVNQGDAIGVTGSTGHSTGPHLHFEITVNGSRVNPANYLP
jgi:murein DD-endopeptidase MepM/ murein hydrolase activator NlpD